MNAGGIGGFGQDKSEDAIAVTPQYIGIAQRFAAHHGDDIHQDLHPSVAVLGGDGVAIVDFEEQDRHRPTVALCPFYLGLRQVEKRLSVVYAA